MFNLFSMKDILSWFALFLLFLFQPLAFCLRKLTFLDTQKKRLPYDRNENCYSETNKLTVHISWQCNCFICFLNFALLWSGMFRQIFSEVKQNWVHCILHSHMMYYSAFLLILTSNSLYDLCELYLHRAIFLHILTLKNGFRKCSLFFFNQPIVFPF